MLRGKLGEQRPYKIILTLGKNEGYKFVAKVRAKGDLGRIDGLLKWSNEHFFELFGKITRNDDDAEDVRITCFRTDIENHGFQELLQRHVRIRIILTNPDNMHLLRARYGLRADETSPEYVQDRIRRQLVLLQQIKNQFPSETLEWRVSDAMPCGFLVHTRHWALLGLFPVQGSYTIGPMIETPFGTPLWQMLYDDWKLRWDNPAKPAIVEKKKR
jgi:hypothetical protein